MSWMDKLPDKLEGSLQSILEMTNRHEESYMSAENASVGQLWVAIAHMNQQINDLEQIVHAQRKALNNLDQEVNVNQHLDENLEESLKRY